MPIIVVTRLRLVSADVAADFFNASISVLEQIKTMDGALGGDALAEANDVWWTVSAWRDRAVMKRFVHEEPHHSVTARLDDWCQEATFVDWEQATSDLPSWLECYRHLVSEGRAAPLTNATEANATLDFPEPVVT
jgi:hypothetical protein